MYGQSPGLLQEGSSRVVVGHLHRRLAAVQMLVQVTCNSRIAVSWGECLKILLVNIILIGRTGTEVVCCETARGLRQRGHDVAIYVQQEGQPAEKLRSEGFHVTTDLSSIAQPPDVIQANQTFPLLEAIGRFPATPAISICHDATVWYNEPLALPSIRRHVAVDLACRDRIASAITDLDRPIEILPNAVDLDAFRQRAPLPHRPTRALVLAKVPNYLDAVRDACAQRGLELSIVGPGINEVSNLPAYFHSHDLVFASARSALEAMAAGCAVIVMDGRGFAGLVTHGVVSSWRQNNFGLRLLTRPVSTELILDAIDRYDAADAQRVCSFIREDSSLDDYLDRLEAIYREVIAESAEQPVDSDQLLYRMSQSIRQIKSAVEPPDTGEFREVCSVYARRAQQTFRAASPRTRGRVAGGISPGDGHQRGRAAGADAHERGRVAGGIPPGDEHQRERAAGADARERGRSSGDESEAPEAGR